MSMTSPGTVRMMETKENSKIKKNSKINSQTDNNRTDTAKSQAMLRKSLTIAVSLFAFCLIVCLVLIFVVSKRIEANNGADVQIKLSAQGGFSCEYSEAQKLYPYGDGCIKVTSERIAYLTLSGSEVFSYSVSYQNPQCVICGNNVAVFDRDGYGFTVLNESGVWYSKPSDDPIKAVQISSKGFAAVISGNSDSFGEVLLYDEKGNQLAEWTSYNSGFPLCCAFNDDSTQLAVSTINTSGAVIVPYVRLFSIDKTAKGYEVTDSAVYTTDDGIIFASVCYLGDKLYCFTANSLYEAVNGNLSMVNFDFSAIGYVKLVNKNLFITYSDGISQLNKLAIINSSDNMIYNSDIGANINCVASNDTFYAISVDRRIFVFNTSGVIVDDLSVDEEIIRMNFLAGDKLCVVSTGGVHTVT